MDLTYLDVAVVYQRRFGTDSYYIRTYRPSRTDAEQWLYMLYENNTAKIERDFKIEVMPLFEVLNALKAENDELREKIESIEENYNR